MKLIKQYTLLLICGFASVTYASTAQANATPEDAKQIVSDLAQDFSVDLLPFGGGKIQLQILQSDYSLATALRQFPDWTVMLSEKTIRNFPSKDSLAVTICHELGHLMGGAPYYKSSMMIGGSPPLNKPTAEGEADYFASHVCLRRLWRDQISENEIAAVNSDQPSRAGCAGVWKSTNDRNLCARIAKASFEFLTEQLDQGVVISFSTPAQTVVSQTLFDAHPAPQCRLDTFLRGALCTKGVTPWAIPGYYSPDPNGRDGELLMRGASCFDDVSTEEYGARPRCWF